MYPEPPLKKNFFYNKVATERESWCCEEERLPDGPLLDLMFLAFLKGFMSVFYLLSANPSLPSNSVWTKERMEVRR